MNNTNNNRINLIQTRRRHQRWILAMVILGVLVSSATFMTLRYNAVAKTYQKRILDCREVSGTVAHIHNTEDCYRNGELVCPLEESEPHEHTEACYTAVLSCGLEENEGHVHTDACFIPQMELACGLEETDGDETHPAHHHTVECYAPVRELICGLEETPGDETHPAHWHTDECYQNVMLQVCGMEEGFGAHYHTNECYQQVLTCEKPVLPVHVHGPECFHMEEMTEEEIAAMNLAESTEASESESTSEEGLTNPEGQTTPVDEVESESSENTETTGDEPAAGTQSAEEDANTEAGQEPEAGKEPTDENADNAVNYPEQHFEGEAAGLLVTVNAPKGAFPQGTEMVVSPIEDEEVLNAATAEVQGEVVLVQGVDITFLDTDGNEIEPLVPIQVEMVPSRESAEIIPDITEVANEQTLVHVDNELSATVMEQEDDTTPEVRFESDSFSAYIVVYTRIEKTILASDGLNYRVSLSYGPEAGIPDGAELAVSEVLSGEATEGMSYEDYAAKAERTLDENQRLTFARFFDITIVVDGAAFQPLAPVEVKIELAEAQDQASEDVKALHFYDDGGIRTIPTSVEEQTVSFNADGFSVYGIVGTKIIETTYLSDSGKLFEVTVTYDESAQIPDGAKLKITEFKEGSAEYMAARKALIADIVARNEEFDASTLGFAALDISVVLTDAEGNILEEVEPAAPVQVEMKVKSLPAVEDLSQVAETLAIQHHVKAQNGVIVENVFDGGAEASFKMNTAEAVIAASGNFAVDPETVTDEQARWYEESSIQLAESVSADEEVRLDDLGINISFETPSFSTFTVTWEGRSSQNSEVGYIYATAAGVNTYQFDDSGIYAGQYSLDTNNLHLMLSDGSSAVPDGVIRAENGTPATGDLYLVYNHTGYWSDGNVSDADSSFHIYFKNNNTTYADITVHYVDSYGNNIRRTNSNNVTYNGGSVDTRNVNVQNGQYYVSGYAGNKDYYRFSNAVFRSAAVAGGSATIRYVDEAGNELNVSNSIAPSSDNADISYLIYDIDGYEYAYCYRNTTDYMMDPILYRQGSVYTLSKDQPGIGHYLQPDDVINVVYKKKAVPTVGGVPLVDRTSEEADPPSILKSSAENGDGTNTLSLSITGSQAPAKLVKLADIIVIFDRSGSMNFNMAGDLVQEYGTTYNYWNENSRIRKAYDALDKFAGSMLEKKNSDGDPLVRMSLISFSDTASVECGFTSDKDELMSAVQGLVGDGGTNWEHALQLANNEFRLAADAENVGAMELDPNRATFVVFVTDGKPTFRMTRDNVKNNEFYENVEASRDISTGSYLTYHVFGPGNEDHHGRNYDAALKEASSIVSNSKILYSIGISGTEAELANLGQLVAAAGAGEGHSVVATTEDKLIEAFDDIAERITGYTGQADIQMNDGITGLTNTISKVNQTDNNRLLGVDGDFKYWRSSAPENWSSWTAEQKAAYTQGMDYANSSSMPEGYESWSDEIKAAFQAGKNVTFSEWTTREADGCAAAVYNTENGAVEWNMGETFMLEDGVTYKVSFICWPSQEAYDILAKLNNGTITFGDTTLYDNKVWNQFEGNATSGYTLKTNAEGANTTYRKAANIDGKMTVEEDEETLYFQHVPPMPLEKDKINVAKTWQASKIDTQDPESVVLQVVGDDELYKQFEIFPTEQRDGSTTNNYGRSDDIYISCGHLKVDKTAGTVVVYESGHDFTLREVEENSRHWDLDASTGRPMKINNLEAMLVLVEGENIPAAMLSNPDLAYCVSGGDEYYRIEGKVYKDTKAWADITGMNTRRSFLDMAKEVLVDGQVWTDTVDSKFTYKITINIDPTTLSWDPDLEKYIIISIRGDGYTPSAAIADTTYPTNAKLPSQSGMAASLMQEGDDNRYLVAESGVEFYLSIRNTWSVRFLNLPAGTTYSIEEVIGEDSEYSFNNVRLETSKDRASAEPDSTQTYTQKKLEGGISETSTLYKVVYQNDTKEQKVKILKTTQDANTPLAGAKFDLYTENAYTSDPKGTPLKKDLISADQTDTKGQIDLGSLPVGKYYLVETAAPAGYIQLSAPVEITVAPSGVTYNQSGNSQSQSNAGIKYDETTKVYTLTVTNNAGVQLPQTGGPGLSQVYLLGLMLTVLAGTGLMMLRKRKTK